MADNPTFNALLDRMRVMHDKKNADYAQDGNPYSNFELAAVIAGCPVDTVFRVLIGVKLARLDELLKGKTPQNESLDDSLLDLSVYAALWASYRIAAPVTRYAPVRGLGEWCHERSSSNRICTRYRGHQGMHIASDELCGTGEIFETWR